MRKIQHKIANILNLIARFFSRLSVRVHFLCYPPEGRTTKEYIKWRMKHPLKAWYYENLLFNDKIC